MLSSSTKAALERLVGYAKHYDDDFRKWEFELVSASNDSSAAHLKHRDCGLTQSVVFPEHEGEYRLWIFNHIERVWNEE